MSLGIGGSISLDGGLVARTDTALAVPANSVKDLLLFELPPATYHLVAVRGSMRSGNFWHELLAPVDSVVGPIEVAAGRITYVGRLTVTGHSRVGRTSFTYTYEWDRDAAREAEALAVVADRYRESQWSPLLQSRLTGLRSPP